MRSFDDWLLCCLVFEIENWKTENVFLVSLVVCKKFLCCLGRANCSCWLFHSYLLFCSCLGIYIFFFSLFVVLSLLEQTGNCRFVVCSFCLFVLAICQLCQYDLLQFLFFNFFASVWLSFSVCFFSFQPDLSFSCFSQDNFSEVSFFSF